MADKKKKQKIERTPKQKAEFKRELTEVVPHLRAFARGLCGRPDMADDLVQETLLKAWAAQERFEPGTSMRAWTFVILRNAYLTDMRRNRFRGEYDEGVAERILTAPAGQEEPLHLSDMHRALLTLPPERREALLLVGAGGFSYEEAAQICGCWQTATSPSVRSTTTRRTARSWRNLTTSRPATVSPLPKADLPAPSKKERARSHEVRRALLFQLGCST